MTRMLTIAIFCVSCGGRVEPECHSLHSEAHFDDGSATFSIEGEAAFGATPLREPASPSSTLAEGQCFAFAETYDRGRSVPEVEQRLAVLCRGRSAAATVSFEIPLSTWSVGPHDVFALATVDILRGADARQCQTRPKSVIVRVVVEEVVGALPAFPDPPSSEYRRKVRISIDLRDVATTDVLGNSCPAFSMSAHGRVLQTAADWRRDSFGCAADR